MSEQNGNGRDLATLSPRHAPLARALELDKDRLVLLSRTLGADLNRDELHLFLAVAARLGLDPFTRQIHAVKDRKSGRFFVHVGIDGRRAIAQRTGLVDGTNGPYWCGPDAEWRDVWLSPEPPAAAMFEVFKKGCARPFRGVARLQSFRGTGPNWSERPDHQLAKVAEDHAWRKAFPFEMGGLPTYVPEHDAGSDDEPLTNGAVEAEYRHIDQETGEVAETNVPPEASAATDGDSPARVKAPPEAPRAMLGAARDLFRQARAAGIPVEPPAAKDQGTLVTWSADVRHRLEIQRGASAESSDRDDVEIELDGADETVAADDFDATVPPQTQAQSSPPWADTPLGKQVSALVDALTEAKARFQLPPNNATEADLEGWLSSKKGLLRARGGRVPS